MPIDAKTAHDNGSIRAVTRGNVDRCKREGSDLVAEVAQPLVDYAHQLVQEGRQPEANELLAHAVHDGVSPASLMMAIIANQKAP